MATPRWLRDDTNPVDATIATAKEVAVGDIVGMSAGTLVKASDTTWNTDTATTQADFRALFLGISGQAKDADVARAYGNSDDNEVRVATSGVYEMDCASATFEVGDFVGPAKDTGDALLDDKVVAAVEAGAIGRVVERGTSITRVKFRVLSILAPLAHKA